jgi:hypothetical protein
MRLYIERSSDAGPSSLRLFCLGCIIATRGYDFREGQVGTMPAAYAKIISDDYAKWGKVIPAAGIKPE